MKAPDLCLCAPDLWRSNEFGSALPMQVRGYLFNKAMVRNQVARIGSLTEKSFGDLVQSIDGHFALVSISDETAFVAVDRVRSIPMFYAWDGHRWVISDNANALIDRFKWGNEDRNPDAARALAMSGYTIGSDTLYQPLKTLTPGQAVILKPDGQDHIIQYNRYSAWDVVEVSQEDALETLTRTTLSILEKLARSVDGRPIFVPLSAGLDSRLIVSGLRHLGVENVKCFSYGIPVNHESQAGEKISRDLGYSWRFVPYTIPKMRAFFASEDHANYLQHADTGTNVPFEQDLPAIRALEEQGYLSKDGVIVNGNSGDFISGGHIPKVFGHLAPDATKDQNLDLVIQSQIQKHYRLWEDLDQDGFNAQIRTRLQDQAQGLPLETRGLHGVYEFLELVNRQSKYVISGQRIYDYAGYDWRLPLWDTEYLNFWQGMPYRFKANQSLYKAMLLKNNWGNVWGDPSYHFPQKTAPSWIRVPRFLLKVAHAPVGAKQWHKFEKRYLTYWMEPLQAQAVVPYSTVAKDRRGARHMVSWHTEKYLNKKGLSWRGEIQ